jgi:hypothetical protein
MKPVEIAFAIPDSILPGAQFGDAYRRTVEGQPVSAFARQLDQPLFTGKMQRADGGECIALGEDFPAASC